MALFGSVQVAAVTGFAPTGAVTAAGTAGVAVGPNVGIIMGGQQAGAIYAPVVGDLVVVAKGPGGEDILVGAFFDPQQPPPWLPVIAAGEFAIGNSAGAYLRFTAIGDIVLVPAVGRSVLLGAASAAVARVGDPVTASGTDSAGNTVTVNGTITSSASEARA